MIWKRPPLIVVLTSLVFTQAAFAIDSGANAEERNYRVIIDRNPFGLRPPPPPPTNTVPVVVQPKDKIFLTGITSFGGLRVHFMTQAPQGKVPEFYTLGLDEKKDDLEVLDIDPVTGSVRVRTGGIESVMTFASDGVKPAATAPAPPGARPGGMPPIPGAIPTPGATAQITPGATAVVPGRSVSVRGRTRTIPSRNVRTPAVNVAPQREAQSDVPPDPNAAVQDVLIMELQKRSSPEISFPPSPMP